MIIVFYVFLFFKNSNKNNVGPSILLDTSTTEYFNGKTDLKVSMDTVDCAAISPCVQLRKPSLSKLDSIDIADCEYISILIY